MSRAQEVTVASAVGYQVNYSAEFANVMRRMQRFFAKDLHRFALRQLVAEVLERGEQEVGVQLKKLPPKDPLRAIYETYSEEEIGGFRVTKKYIEGLFQTFYAHPALQKNGKPNEDFNPRGIFCQYVARHLDNISDLAAKTFLKSLVNVFLAISILPIERKSTAFASFPPQDLLCLGGSGSRLEAIYRQITNADTDNFARIVLDAHNSAMAQAVEVVRPLLTPGIQVHALPYLGFILGYRTAAESAAIDNHYLAPSSPSQLSKRENYAKAVNTYYRVLRSLLSKGVEEGVAVNRRNIQTIFDEVGGVSETFSAGDEEGGRKIQDLLRRIKELDPNEERDVVNSAPEIDDATYKINTELLDDLMDKALLEVSKVIKQIYDASIPHPFSEKFYSNFKEILASQVALGEGEPEQQILIGKYLKLFFAIAASSEFNRGCPAYFSRIYSDLFENPENKPLADYLEKNFKSQKDKITKRYVDLALSGFVSETWVDSTEGEIARIAALPQLKITAKDITEINYREDKSQLIAALIKLINEREGEFSLSQILEFLPIYQRLNQNIEELFLNAIAGDLRGCLSYEDLKGSNLLIIASEFGLVKVVTKLLELGVNPNIRNLQGNTALICAATKGHEAVVKVLLAREDVKLAINNNGDDASKGHTILTHAVYHKHEGVVKTLLAAGVNPDAKNTNGNSPLILAISGGDIAIVTALLEANANPNAQDHLGNPALLCAAANGYDEIVRELLAREVDPNVQNIDGETSLMWAASRGQLAVVELLLAQEKTNPYLKNNRGKTALMMAQFNGHSDIVEILQKRDLEHSYKARDRQIIRNIFDESNRDKFIEALITDPDNEVKKRQMSILLSSLNLANHRQDEEMKIAVEQTIISLIAKIPQDWREFFKQDFQIKNFKGEDAFAGYKKMNILDFAFQANSWGIVEALLDNEWITTESRFVNGKSLLHRAIKLERFEIGEKLVARDPKIVEMKNSQDLDAGEYLERKMSHAQEGDDLAKMQNLKRVISEANIPGAAVFATRSRREAWGEERGKARPLLQGRVAGNEGAAA